MWQTSPSSFNLAKAGLSDRRVRSQIETLLFGPMNVTRAALPVMRQQRSGLLLTVSSTAGISGGAFTTAYTAAKFGLEGWAEALAPEVAPFAAAVPGMTPQAEGFISARVAEVVGGAAAYEADKIACNTKHVW